MGRYDGLQHRLNEAISYKQGVPACRGLHEESRQAIRDLEQRLEEAKRKQDRLAEESDGFDLCRVALLGTIDDLRAKLEAAEAERDALRRTYEGWDQQKTFDDLRDKLKAAEAERDGLHSLKCEIGIVLGDEAGPPFVDTIRKMKADLAAARDANVELEAERLRRVDP